MFPGEQFDPAATGFQVLDALLQSPSRVVTVHKEFVLFVVFLRRSRFYVYQVHIVHLRGYENLCYDLKRAAHRKENKHNETNKTKNNTGLELNVFSKLNVWGIT